VTYDHQRRSGRRLTATVTDLEVARQRAFLVGVQLPSMSLDEAGRSLAELALLTDTAGSDPIDEELVRRPEPDPALFIGKGKAEDLARLTDALDIDVVVFDNDLTPAQQRNLQKVFGCDVVDREALILDIFAQHATSREGAVQVELALLRYRLPRLRGRGKELSQQGAGIGTRGPGETKLETDRRRILARIAKLERELEHLSRTRATQRKARRRSDLPQMALVGYTNAGKSTLLNRLTQAEVLVENRLFSTLDPTVRRCVLPDGRFALLSDTVGFVRRLPHHLVEAFRSTLDDVKEADLLLHVVDASDPDPEGQISAVRTVLSEIEATGVPELLVLNKVDTAEPVSVRRLVNLHPEAVAVSALTGEGLEQLLERAGERLEKRTSLLHLAIPYGQAEVAAAAHRLGEVLAEKHDEHGTVLDVRMPLAHVDRFRPYVVA
jgi:GTP-binding protein HflX